VDKRRIEIPDPIKSLGEHVVNVKLPGDVRTQLRVMVEPLPAAEVAEIAEEAPAEEASEAPAADAETGPSD
jgi:hypothetical protein